MALFLLYNQFDMPYGSKILTFALKGIIRIVKTRSITKEASILGEVLGSGTEYVTISEVEKQTMDKIMAQLKKGGRGITKEVREARGRDMLVDVYYHEKGTTDFIREFANEKLQKALNKSGLNKSFKEHLNDMVEEFRLDKKTKSYMDRQINKIKDTLDPRKNKYVVKIENILKDEDGMKWDDHANPLNIFGLSKSSWIDIGLSYSKSRKQLRIASTTGGH